MAPFNLYYGNTANWEPLPGWGCFFLDLGIALTAYENAQKRIVVGLALPTRSYAASLIALGATTGKFASTNRDREAMRRFQQLSELKNGTPLIYRRKREVIKVFFDGLEVMDGETKLCLNTMSAKGGRYWITSKQALQVEFPTKSSSKVPKRPSRRINARLSPFLSSLFDSEVAATIVSQSSLDSLIIGSLWRLKEETQDQQFAAKTAYGFASGVLQDVVRIRRFSKATETYRSEIYHVTSKDCENLGQEIPTIIIFEGATSFLRWRNFWCQSNWVVLLDQTELEFDLAVQTFNDEYIRSPVNDREISNFPLIPTHIPTAMYQETYQ